MDMKIHFIASWRRDGLAALDERFLSYWRGHTGSQPGLVTRGIGVFRCLGTRGLSGGGKNRI